MQKIDRSRTWSLFVLLLSFTGCITIEENYTFKKDGSGTLEYVVDMSEIGDMMEAFEDASDDGASAGEGDMGAMDMNDEVVALKAIPGIKKVKVNDKKKYVQRLSFSFADLKALNQALNVLLSDSTGEQHTFFTWEGNTLIRTNNDHARQMGKGMGAEEEGTDSMETTRFLESMKYKYSFTFAKPVGTTALGEGMVEERPSSRQVKMDTDWSKISRDPKALDLRIELTQ
ncbi:MAG: hypothetical protein KDC00_11420 [Flavobacteriales bacterium]|nr:hypothetical protein [Flavobacteriales bacterium]